MIVNVEGSLRIASGCVYSFCEFTQPISERLTDEAWRNMIPDTPRPAWSARFTAPPWG